jgi:hypothetical protein
MSANSLAFLIAHEVDLLKQLDEIRAKKFAMFSGAPIAAGGSSAPLRPAAVKSKPGPKPAAPTTPTKQKVSGGAGSDVPPAAPKKITLTKKKTPVADADDSSMISATSAVSMNIQEHFRAYKSTKRAQFKAADPSMSDVRLRTAIRRAYTLEYPAEASALTALEKQQEEEKRANPPELNAWQQYVQKVREEGGIETKVDPKTGLESCQFAMSYKDAITEASRRRRAGDPEAPPVATKPLSKRAAALAAAAAEEETDEDE